MALTDFFRINFPYGILRNENNEWAAFNREYLPLGEIDERLSHNKERYHYSAYNSVTESFLLKLAEGGQIERDKEGKIKIIWLYKDGTNPASTPKHWDRYLTKIKLLGKLQIKVNSVIA